MKCTVAELRAFATSVGRGGAAEEMSLGDLGLEMDPDCDSCCRREATPTNATIFARTGGDGVHYCLLHVGASRDDGPVVMVVPFNFDQPRLVVGDNLRDFLSLGSVTGFFFLEELVYEKKAALDYLFDWDAFVRRTYDGTPSEDDAADLTAQRQTLSRLSQEFGLIPWRNPAEHLAALQQRWMSGVNLDARQGTAR